MKVFWKCRYTLPSQVRGVVVCLMGDVGKSVKLFFNILNL